MNFIQKIENITNNFVQEKTNTNITLRVQEVNPNYEGDITIVLFPLFKLKINVNNFAEELYEHLNNELGYFENYNIVKGFLNLSFSNKFYTGNVELLNNEIMPAEEIKTYLLEYPSPNTNKPLHLGHLRNIFIGEASRRMLKALGHKVFHCNLYNDKGIHICKSMLAYQKFGNGETPETTGKKGDHFVGDYYVLFDKKAKENPELNEEVQEMYRKWEQNDPQVIALWEKMNSWVYEGFNKTFERLDITFDKHYYESKTYKLGRKIVEEGLQKGIFYKEEDGSVWVDLTDEGLDKKLLLRSDGTSVYITQDLGTTELKDNDFNPDLSVFVIADEQNYHMKVLKAILKKLEKPYADTIYHLSYGMVDLPTGKMKSREGTVIDADDILDEMHNIAKKITEEQGKIQDIPEEERPNYYEAIGQSALKYYILKVNPKKRMLFDKEKSIDFKGYTGPFLLYTYARILSIHRKAQELPEFLATELDTLKDITPVERELLNKAVFFQEKVKESAYSFDPSHLANYLYDLAKTYNSFYHDHPVLGEKDPQKRFFRYLLSMSVARTLKKGLEMLHIKVIDRM